MTESRPPFPPFDMDSALEKVQAAEDAWNTRDPERVALAYTPDSVWRNRDVHLIGRPAIVEFLTAKWEREQDYALREASINDRRIEEAERRIFGPRRQEERRAGTDEAAGAELAVW